MTCKTSSLKNERYLWIALGLTAIFTCVEMIGGWLSGSLALLSDAAHMFTDVASLVIALIAMQIGKKGADAKRTFGYYRFEILAAVANAVILFLVAFYIFYEAYQRIKAPENVHSTSMIIIASIGLLVNWITIRLLKTGSQHNLNVRGAYLEAWADLLSSIGVICAAAIIYVTGWERMDSIIAIAIGLWVLPRTWLLLKESINILLEGVPEGIELAQVHTLLINIPGVIDVHDLHIWALTSGKISLTAHLVIDKHIQTEHAILHAATQLIETKFEVTHSTIQIEIENCDVNRTFKKLIH